MQVVLFILILLLIAGIVVANPETLPKKYKWVLLAVLLSVALLGWWYEASNSAQNEKNREVLAAFKQGKTLMCNGVEVSQKTFIYVSGTLSFIPNENNHAHQGMVFESAACHVQ